MVRPGKRHPSSSVCMGMSGPCFFLIRHPTESGDHVPIVQYVPPVGHADVVNPAQIPEIGGCGGDF